MAKDYYKILGVDRNASEADIKKAFRTLSKKWHPDKFANDTEEKKKEADEKFKEINEANSVLSDQKKRKMYDMGGGDFSQMGGEGFSGFGDFGGFGGFGGFGRYSDWFKEDFGGFSPFGHSRKRKSTGDDIQINITITAKEAYTGVRREIKYKKQTPCSHCNGTGSESKTPSKCPHCNGLGRIIRTTTSGNSIFQTETYCPHCNGTGKVINDPCRVCGGKGYEEKEESMAINIPAGIMNDTALILSGYGNPPIDGEGENGNIIVKVSVIDEEKYIRDGDNLVIKLNLTAEEAWIGCQKEVVLPDDSKVWVTVNEMTKPEEIISIFGGKGYHNLNMPTIVGDLIVVANYKWPNKLNDKQKELLKEFFNEENIKNNN